MKLNWNEYEIIKSLLFPILFHWAPWKRGIFQALLVAKDVHNIRNTETGVQDNFDRLSLVTEP